MSLELQIIRACDFVRLGAEGRIDLAASREILKQLAGACRMRGINQALLDLREMQPGATPMLSVGDLGMLVSAFREMGFSDRQRLAVLYSSDPHHRARLFAFISAERGWTVKACRDFEEALLWLSEGESGQRETEAKGEKIPVQFAQPSPDSPAQQADAGNQEK